MDKASRILIVDDDHLNIKLLTIFLREDYKITAVNNGESALEAVQDNLLPDLILLDIMMPGIDGYEVCKRLKENERTQNIPVIFVTAVKEIEDAARGFKMGAVDYIEKPLNPLLVKARVDLHIKLHQTMQELKDALSQVKQLRGLLPICMYCKKIRDDNGYWNQLEAYLGQHLEAEFSHGICRECAKEHYPGLDLYDDEEQQ